MIPHNRPWIIEADREAVERVLRSGWIGQGDEVRKLEAYFENRYGEGQAVAVSSGTAALWLALRVLLPTAGSNIQLPTYACSAILHAIEMAGCRPCLRDVDPATYSLKGQGEARHALLIDTFGARAAIDNNFGARIRDLTHTPSSTPHENDDAVICSFGATKPVTGGSGGVVWFKDVDKAVVALALRDFDGQQEYRPSFNVQMSDITAALVNSQLARIEEIEDKRDAIETRYLEVLPLCYPIAYTGMRYRYVVEVPDADDFINYMEDHNVQCIRPIAPFELLHRYLGVDPKAFPVAEMIARKAVSLPFYPSLHEAEIARVCAALKEYRL